MFNIYKSIYLLVLEFSFPSWWGTSLESAPGLCPCWDSSWSLSVSLGQCLDSAMHRQLSSKLIHHLWFIHVILLYIHTHTECNRRNGPDFGRVFLRSNYTDITQNTYIQSWTVTEILGREKSGLLWCLRTVLVGDVILPPTWTEFLCYR